MTATRIPKALIILDGFGIEHTASSAIEAAQTPTWDQLLANNPNSRIETSGLALPAGTGALFIGWQRLPAITELQGSTTHARSQTGSRQ